MIILMMWIAIHMPSPELLSQNQSYWIKQLQNPSPDLRMNALAVLGELKDPDTVDRIASTLSDREPRVRFYAIQALAKIVSDSSARALTARIDAESDPYLKSELRRASKSVDDLLKAQASKAAESGKR